MNNNNTNAMGKVTDRNQMRKEIERRVCEIMHGLMSTGSTNAVWCGTRTDLVELTYVAWKSNTFFDNHGKYISFHDMVEHVFKTLHCQRVSNPYSMMYRARKKKGVFGMSVIDRYVNLMASGGITNPMRLDIRFIK